MNNEEGIVRRVVSALLFAVMIMVGTYVISYEATSERVWGKDKIDIKFDFDGSR